MMMMTELNANLLLPLLWCKGKYYETTTVTVTLFTSSSFTLCATYLQYKFAICMKKCGKHCVNAIFFRLICLPSVWWQIMVYNYLQKIYYRIKLCRTIVFLGLCINANDLWILRPKCSDYVFESSPCLTLLTFKPWFYYYTYSLNGFGLKKWIGRC